jgi:hypothetical protein
LAGFEEIMSRMSSRQQLKVPDSCSLSAPPLSSRFLFLGELAVTLDKRSHGEIGHQSENGQWDFSRDFPANANHSSTMKLDNPVDGACHIFFVFTDNDNVRCVPR